MVYLTAAVVLVGLLCLLDLVLTLGVIRRLREHTKLLSEMPQGMPSGLPDGGGVPVGETVAEFEATTVSGEALTQEQLSGRTLVGFFSPGCKPCADMLPTFVDYARSMSSESRVLAVVVGGTEEDEYVGKLTPVAQVVAEEPEGPMQSAFQVSGYPTVYLLDPGGVVVAAGLSMSALDSVPGAAPASLAAAQAAPA